MSPLHVRCDATSESRFWVRVTKIPKPHSLDNYTHKAGKMDLGPQPEWDPTWVNAISRTSEVLVAACVEVQLWAHYACCYRTSVKHQRAEAAMVASAVEARGAEGSAQEEGGSQLMGGGSQQ